MSMQPEHIEVRYEPSVDMVAVPPNPRGHIRVLRGVSSEYVTDDTSSISGADDDGDEQMPDLVPRDLVPRLAFDETYIRSQWPMPMPASQGKGQSRNAMGKGKGKRGLGKGKGKVSNGKGKGKGKVRKNMGKGKGKGNRGKDKGQLGTHSEPEI